MGVGAFSAVRRLLLEELRVRVTAQRQRLLLLRTTRRSLKQEVAALRGSAPLDLGEEGEGNEDVAGSSFEDEREGLLELVVLTHETEKLEMQNTVST